MALSIGGSSSSTIAGMQGKSQAAVQRLEDAKAQTNARLESRVSGGLAEQPVETRNITQQRAAGTSLDSAGQRANAIAAPSWQSTMQLAGRGAVQQQEKIRSTDSPRSTDAMQGASGANTQGAGRSTLSLGVVNQAGGAASSSNSTQGRTMSGEQGSSQGITQYQQLQQAGPAQLAQANARPQQALSLMV